MLIVVVEIIPKCVVVDVGEGFVANMKVDGLAVVKVYVDVHAPAAVSVSSPLRKLQNVCVYYCITYYKAVRVGGGG